MSEDIAQELGELQVTDAPEAGSEPASTTPQGEESKPLELEPEKPNAEEQKEKQLATLQRKIENGELTLDGLNPQQKWAKAELEKRIALKQKEEIKATELDVDAIVERKLAEKQEDKEFEALKSELEKQDLSIEEREALTIEYKDLRKAGLGKLVALQKAKKLAQISENKPRPSAPSYRPVKEGKKADSLEAIMRLPEEKRLAELKKLTL